MNNEVNYVSCDHNEKKVTFKGFSNIKDEFTVKITSTEQMLIIPGHITETGMTHQYFTFNKKPNENNERFLFDDTLRIYCLRCEIEQVPDVFIEYNGVYYQAHNSNV